MITSIEGCLEDYNAVPPRDGCSCRACYRARETELPLALREFVKDMGSISAKKIGSPIVWNWIQSYLHGNVSLDTAQVGMLKDLVDQNERLFAELNLIFNRKPIVNLDVP